MGKKSKNKAKRHRNNASRSDNGSNVQRGGGIAEREEATPGEVNSVAATARSTAAPPPQKGAAGVNEAFLTEIDEEYPKLTDLFKRCLVSQGILEMIEAARQHKDSEVGTRLGVLFKFSSVAEMHRLVAGEESEAESMPPPGSFRLSNVSPKEVNDMRGHRYFGILEACDPRSETNVVLLCLLSASTKKYASMGANLSNEGVVRLATDVDDCDVTEEGQQEFPPFPCCGCGETVQGGLSSGSRKLYRCDGCFTTQYCSKACHKKHWRAGHKHKCAHIMALRQEGKRLVRDKA